jgi:hypothetical protein
MIFMDLFTFNKLFKLFKNLAFLSIPDNELPTRIF